MKTLPGFRDFYPEDCARREFITGTWREVARRYGFVEYDGPVLEPFELFAKKSGGEIAGQLFEFTDKGGRHVSLRPEMTPTLARMVAARSRDYRKPLKWFSVASFFRYEKQQRGRLREFLQLNCDLLGDERPAADAELVALAIDLLRAFGLTREDFVVRLSDRRAWLAFLERKGHGADRAQDFLAIIDKMEREPAETVEAKLREFGCGLSEVRDFIANPADASPEISRVTRNLCQRGLGGFFEIDLTIVRGLAYYTGMVFEIFDRGRTLRALAGGGRYDRLVHHLSDGAADLPALGFGMGDVVLGELIAATPRARVLMETSVRTAGNIDVFVAVADETRRSEALALVQSLRDAGLRVDYPMGPVKLGKQFQSAELAGARHAVLVGTEWPGVKVKELATRTEREMSADAVVADLSSTAAVK